MFVRKRYLEINTDRGSFIHYHVNSDYPSAMKFCKIVSAILYENNANFAKNHEL